MQSICRYLRRSKSQREIQATNKKKPEFFFFFFPNRGGETPVLPTSGKIREVPTVQQPAQIKKWRKKVGRYDKVKSCDEEKTPNFSLFFFSPNRGPEGRSVDTAEWSHVTNKNPVPPPSGKAREVPTLTPPIKKSRKKGEEGSRSVGRYDKVKSCD